MTRPAHSDVQVSQPIGASLHRLGFVAGAVARLLDVRVWSQVRLLLDVTMLCLAATAAVYAAPIHPGHSGIWLVAVFPAVTLVILRARRDPDERLRAPTLDTAAHVLGATSLSAMLMVAVGSIMGGGHPVGLALRLWLFAAAYLSVARVMLNSVRAQAVRNQALATPTLIVGAGVIGGRLVDRLTGDRSYGLRPVGFLDADPMPKDANSSGSTIPVLGGPENLADAVRQIGARHVILAFSSESDHVLVDKVRECERLGVKVSLVPRMFEAINDRAVLDHVGGLPLISLRPTNPRGWQFAIKHGLDSVFALLALVALAPVMAMIALGVRLGSPGPVLFRQRRIGRDGHEFTMLKFRTMRGDPALDGEADAGWVAKIRGQLEGITTRPVDPPVDRTTRVGRYLRATSLDEVPQLFNVLRGEMSLVGPRPERISYAHDFEHLVQRYADRHRVKSGMTGWAQVNGLRGQTSIADRVEWDNHYIRNWSLGFDLKIMMLTVAEVLRFRDSQKARKYAGSPSGAPPRG